MSESVEQAAPGTPHEIGLAQARERALWELGDPSWADVIIAAYRNPASDHAMLEREKAS